MFIFHIDLTLTVAMATENGRQYRLKYRKCLFRPHFGDFTDSQISAQLKTKKIFKYFMYLVIIYHPFKCLFWYLPVLYVNWPVKPPDFGSK